MYNHADSAILNYFMQQTQKHGDKLLSIASFLQRSVNKHENTRFGNFTFIDSTNTKGISVDACDYGNSSKKVTVNFYVERKHDIYTFHVECYDKNGNPLQPPRLTSKNEDNYDDLYYDTQFYKDLEIKFELNAEDGKDFMNAVSECSTISLGDFQKAYKQNILSQNTTQETLDDAQGKEAMKIVIDLIQEKAYENAEKILKQLNNNENLKEKNSKVTKRIHKIKEDPKQQKNDQSQQKATDRKKQWRKQIEKQNTKQQNASKSGQQL